MEALTRQHFGGTTGRSCTGREKVTVTGAGCALGEDGLGSRAGQGREGAGKRQVRVPSMLWALPAVPGKVQ